MIIENEKLLKKVVNLEFQLQQWKLKYNALLNSITIVPEASEKKRIQELLQEVEDLLN